MQDTSYPTERTTPPAQTAIKAWQTARGQLQLEMEPATFDSRLRAARLVSASGEQFTVGVESHETRDWLEHRVSTRLSRLLTGITNTQTAVRFVVSEMGASGNPHEAVAPHERLAAAFAAAQLALQQQVSQSDFHAHIRSLRVLHFDAETLQCQLGAGDPDAVLWINIHVRHSLTKLLSAAYGQTLDVQVLPARGVTADPSLAEPEESMALRRALTGLKDVFYRENLGHSFPRYLFRWIPYLDTKAFWTLIAFRQAFFTQRHCAPSDNDRAAISLRAVAEIIGSDKNTIMKHRDSGRLNWFLQHAPTRKFKFIGDGTMQREAHDYIFHTVAPLTPQDQDQLRSWLRAHEVGRDPLAALQQALATDPREILPAKTPGKKHLQRKPDSAPSLQQLVLALVPEELGTQDTADLLARIEDLQAHLISGFGQSYVSLYFMRHWLPRVRETAAAFILLSRQSIYVNEQRGEYREYMKLASLEEQAEKLGKSVQTLKRFLPAIRFTAQARPGRKSGGKPSAARARAQTLKEHVGRFIFKIEQHKDSSLRLHVSKRDPLLPDHLAEYHAALLLLAHFIGQHGSSFSEAAVNAFIADLTALGAFGAQERISKDSDIGIYNNAYIDNHKDAYIDISNNPDIGVSKESDNSIYHNPDIDIAKLSDNGVSKDSDIADLSAFRHILMTLNNKPFNHISEESLRNYLLQLINTNQHAEQPEATSKLDWSPRVGVVWTWENVDLHGALRRDEKQDLIAQAVSAVDLIAWLLYAYSRDGQNINSPVRFAITRFRGTDGSPKHPQAVYLRLAKLGPRGIQGLLKSSLGAADLPGPQSNPAALKEWQMTLGQAGADKLFELGELLGLVSRTY